MKVEEAPRQSFLSLHIRICMQTATAGPTPRDPDSAVWVGPECADLSTVGHDAAATPGLGLRITADYLLLLGSTWKQSVLSSVLKRVTVFVQSLSHV